MARGSILEGGLTRVPLPRKPENSPPKINGLQTEIDDPIPLPVSRKTPRRRRTEQAAIKSLDGGIKLPAQKRREAIGKIRAARQPSREALRLVKMFHKETLKPEREIDLSAAQVLRVKLIRRDGGIWPPQSTCLADLEHRIVAGISKAEFTDTAATILAIPQALPINFRKLESRGAA